MTWSRRDALLGFGGFVLGGALAVSGGLGSRAHRRRSRAAAAAPVPPPPHAVELGGWILTDEDLAAFAADDGLRTSDVLEVRDAVDLPGGDYRSFRVDDLGACITACETDESCAAFTYARISHGLPDKRRMCWLKDETTGAAATALPDYVSGRRGGW